MNLEEMKERQFFLPLIEPLEVWLEGTGWEDSDEIACGVAAAQRGADWVRMKVLVGAMREIMQILEIAGDVHTLRITAHDSGAIARARAAVSVREPAQVSVPEDRNGQA